MFTRRLFVGNVEGKKFENHQSLKYGEKLGIYRYFFTVFSRNFQIFPTRAGHPWCKICPNIKKKKKKNIRWYLVIWSRFASKCGNFQSGSKIVDLGFVKFKSNGTKSKRPLEQIHKTQEWKKSNFFFLFSLGVLQGFSRKWNDDEFSRKSNGGWIFLGIKRDDFNFY